MNTLSNSESLANDWLAVTPACPVCAASTVWLDAVDFNKNNMEPVGVVLPRTGRAIYYALCVACGFCFAPEMHTWSAARLAERVYNDGYVQVDPDYVEKRPTQKAGELLGIFPALAGNGVQHLDYGSGSGRMSQLLEKGGWASSAYDPFVPGQSAPAAHQRFGVITAFEVFEHVADLDVLAGFIDRHLASDGLLIITTLLNDGEVKVGRRLDWWYASPRNGHISLFSARSLDLMLARCGLTLHVSANSGVHFACRGQWPTWAQHMFTNARQ